MSRYKAIIFDIGGVLVPQPQIAIRKYGEQLKLPSSFLGKVFTNGAPDNAFCRLERGELLLSQFAKEFESEVIRAGQKEGIEVSNFNALTLFDQMAFSFAYLRREMLHAVKVLSCNNFKTCALTNNWIDDREIFNEVSSKFMVILHQYFDLVIESAKVGLSKPDPAIYRLACEKMGIEPSEAIFLDDIGANLKGASKLGIKCIKVQSSTEALKELQKLTDVNITMDPQQMFAFPPPCKPAQVPHAKVSLKSGVQIHYVDMGDGPVVMLFHGFPESWYSWRHQIPALVAAGYRVIALDQRGYGDSSKPNDIKEYTQKKICKDATDLMDKLGITKCTVVGHDWGGVLVWALALFHPDRLKGVCSINTPFFKGRVFELFQEQKEVFDYHAYFQEPGIAEREFEEDLERSFNFFFRGVGDDPLENPGKMIRDTTSVTKRGGMMIGFPKKIPRSWMLTRQDLEYYVGRYKENGFRGPLNWYRNHEENAKWLKSRMDRKIDIPALMVTSSHDSVLRPEFTQGMEERVTNLTRLELQRCGHWTQMEKPDKLNEGLIKWLDVIHTPKSKL